jgi:HK97 family phage portal protein
MRLWPFGTKQEQRNAENPGHAITPDDVYGRTVTGKVVNPDTVLKVSAALACVRVLAESVGSLSWITYERVSSGGKRRATDNYAYRVLHDRPNPLMSSMAFRERIMKDLLLHGNAYVYRENGRYGALSALWPLAPVAVTPIISKSGRGVQYRVTSSTGFDGVYGDQEILHVSALGDGVVGKSVIAYNAGSFSLSMAEDEYAQNFYENGAYPGGVLEVEKPLGDEGRKRLRAGWSNAYSNQGAHKVAVLEDGIKWKPMTVNPKDAMALESRKFQVSDIARMFRVPPHMIGDLERATFSNIEHQSLEFVMHSLRPWLIRIEQEFNWKLFGLERADREFFSEFLIDSMLRGDIKSRNEAYAIMRQNGVINADEWRERENLNPLPDDAGKKYIVQLNMQELGSIGTAGVERALSKMAKREAI